MEFRSKKDGTHFPINHGGTSAEAFNKMQEQEAARKSAVKLGPKEAKQIIQNELVARGLPFTKLRASTVGFSDLLRSHEVVVTIDGWQPNPAWDELKAIAKHQGFILMAK